MSNLEDKAVALEQDRRRAARFSITCSATFRTVSGDRKGMIENVSELGARFACKTPPVDGVTGLLLFGGNEIFCKVAWANTDACGLVFDHPISLELVAALAGVERHKVGPVANTGNIQMGRRRGGLVTRDDD